MRALAVKNVIAGDGIVRYIEFHKTMSAGILSSHRSKPPFGLQAGAPGSLGVNRLILADGSIEQLPGCAEVQDEPGDAIEIETPGGGG